MQNVVWMHANVHITNFNAKLPLEWFVLSKICISNEIDWRWSAVSNYRKENIGRGKSEQITSNDQLNGFILVVATPTNEKVTTGRFKQLQVNVFHCTCALSNVVATTLFDNLFCHPIECYNQIMCLFRGPFDVFWSYWKTNCFPFVEELK